MMRQVLPLLILALFLPAVAPLDSSRPDGLEKVAQMLGFDHLASENPILKSPFPDYVIQSWGDGHLSTVLAGLIGTLLCFFLPFSLYLFRQK